MAIFVALSYQGLSFFPHKIFTSKNKTHAAKENQCTTLWHFNGFPASRGSSGKEPLLAGNSMVFFLTK